MTTSPLIVVRHVTLYTLERRYVTRYVHTQNGYKYTMSHKGISDQISVSEYYYKVARKHWERKQRQRRQMASLVTWETVR